MSSSSANETTPEPSEIKKDMKGIHKVLARNSSSVTKLSKSLDDTNWWFWKAKLKKSLYICGVSTYVQGVIPCPNEIGETEKWDHNDNYAQYLIMNNVTSPQMVHISQCKTLQAMWNSLEAIHETKGRQVAISLICNLFHAVAGEGADISEHLNTMKSYWERISMLDDEDFKSSDKLFKVIISLSLPLSWHLHQTICWWKV